jgi:hypothetical protein
LDSYNHNEEIAYLYSKSESKYYEIRLALRAYSNTAGIHNVFHVSQLKFCTTPAATVIQHPSAPPLHAARGEPERILDRKMVKRGRTAATKVLVQWKNQSPDAATWEFYYDLLKEFPNFHP